MPGERDRDIETMPGPKLGQIRQYLAASTPGGPGSDYHQQQTRNYLDLQSIKKSPDMITIWNYNSRHLPLLDQCFL